MALYDEFRFKPAPWLPHSELPLEELERIRTRKREKRGGFENRLLLKEVTEK